MNLINITNKLDVQNHLNEWVESNCNTTRYRIVPSKSDLVIISNVPDSIYNDSRLKKYSPPNSNNRYNDEHFINFLCQSLNFAHENAPELCNGYEDGKVFHLNQCYDNSLAAYNILYSLTVLNDLPVSSNNCICFGYVSKHILPGALLGNAVINLDGLVMHDWHVWNKINDFIVDISLHKNAGVFPLGTQNVMWEKAENHIFKTTPEAIDYYGIEFEDHTQFINFAHDIFN
jgi:hypothetical protein